jgi:hypothetical protein
MSKEKISFGLSIVLLCVFFFGNISAQNNNSNQTTKSNPANTNSESPVKTPEPRDNFSGKCDTALADYDLSKGFLKVGGSSFSDFIKKRDVIIAEVAALEQKIKELSDKSSKALPAIELRKRLDNLKQIENNPNRTPDETDRMFDYFASGLASYMTYDDLQSKEKLTEQLNNAQNELKQKKYAFGCVESAIDDFTFNSPEQSFKFWMSLIFAFLIASVIAGFYFLSNKDENIRRAIFTGQTGIQFLTLFSIVIAIILFGITGILQDKELAALLGGLSGYILGRYSQEKNPAIPPPKPPNPPAQPNGG